jgi:poly(A) polymerase
LLHDIGKPASKTLGRDQRIHFYGHGQKSADQALDICLRLKFSRRAVQYIDFIIRNHLRPLFLFVAGQKQNLKHKGMVRFFRKCGSLTPDLLVHTMADIMGKSRTSTTRDADFIGFARETLDLFFQEYGPRASLPPLITGHDLIKELGLQPSPLFKLVLRRVEEARVTGNIHTKEEALALARQMSAQANAASDNLK